MHLTQILQGKKIYACTFSPTTSGFAILIYLSRVHLQAGYFHKKISIRIDPSPSSSSSTESTCAYEEQASRFLPANTERGRVFMQQDNPSLALTLVSKVTLPSLSFYLTRQQQIRLTRASALGSLVRSMTSILPWTVGFAQLFRRG